MASIKTYTTENAEGKVKEIYDAVLQKMPFIPKPMQLTSASPEILSAFAQTLHYFMAHGTLSPVLLSYIRFVVAFNSDYPYCIDLNGQLLKMMAGLSNEQLTAVREDPSLAPLEEKDKAMLLFVYELVTAPEEVKIADIDNLRALGWTDTDIFDAAYHGANMVSAGILFNAFNMQED